MKLAFCFCILSSCFFAQSNFTVFNNNGQTFYVILNGVKQNSLPQTNVVVSGLVNSAYSVKLIFSDGKTADINKNFSLILQVISPHALSLKKEKANYN